MLKKTMFLSLLMLLLASLSLAGDDKSIIGVYDKVQGKEFTYNGKQVEIIEFLSFYCGHCYHFERSIPVIKGNFPKKIRWKTVPVYWGTGSPKPGEAYLLAVDQGKGEEMKKALFDAVFVEKQDIGKLEVLEGIGVNIGLGFDFSTKLRGGEKAAAAAEAVKMAGSYGVNETPSLIIAGNLRTSPGKVNGNVDLLRDNTIMILKSILKK
ncbi:MAG: DsbA family protein [Nitrospiraceae bacterium]|nr:MAG: DsbA family protein [Nitrospiraceae bacterium]